MTTVLDDLPKSDPKSDHQYINVYCLNPPEWKDIRGQFTSLLSSSCRICNIACDHHAEVKNLLQAKVTLSAHYTRL